MHQKSGVKILVAKGIDLGWVLAWPISVDLVAKAIDLGWVFA